MIEDNEVKVAENPIEALWIRNRDATKQRIKELENAMIVEKAFLEMCEMKIIQK